MSKVYLLVFGLGVLCCAHCQSTEATTKVREGKLGFLNGATTMLTSLAQDLVSRSAANSQIGAYCKTLKDEKLQYTSNISQVLSLNLTNLFILLVLKAIIFGAGAFGYGHGGYGRNVDGLIQENLSQKVNFDRFLSESELLLMLSYLKADSTQKYGCLQRAACENPRKAKEYAFTGKLLLNGSQFFTKSLNGTRYENIFTHIDEGISSGLKGVDCSARYQCEGS